MGTPPLGTHHRYTELEAALRAEVRNLGYKIEPIHIYVDAFLDSKTVRTHQADCAGEFCLSSSCPAAESFSGVVAFS